ncbi:MAG: hypothetical protein GTO16_10865 [Candidatus Aminicenantes bacterium]|nr:hypothetical protein [Candidatus Aminicenantes bacterium]
MNKKVLIPIAVCLSIIFMSGNSLAAKSSGYKTFKGEISLIAGPSIDPWDAFYVSSMVIAGIGIANVISLEASIVFLGSFDRVYSANLGLSIFNRKRVIPFVTVGLGRCKHSLPYLNLGGGIKFGLKDKLGVRVECRWWNSDDVSLISVLGGISYSF